MKAVKLCKIKLKARGRHVWEFENKSVFIKNVMFTTCNNVCILCKSEYDGNKGKIIC